MAKPVLSNRQKDIAALILLTCLTSIFLWRVVFLGRVLLPLDMVFTSEPWRSEAVPLTSVPWNPEITDAIWQSYPLATYSQHAWQQGMPLWDPTMLGGMPALARGDMFSNPVFNLLAVFLPAAQAISWTAVIHLLIGSWCTWMLLRVMGTGQFGALVGSLVFAFNAYSIGWLSLPVVSGSMAWLPLIFLGIELALRRQNWRWICLSALGFTLQILSGAILWPFYGAITLILFNLYRSIFDWWETKKLIPSVRPILYAGLALLIGAVIAAPQLLLTMELYLNTARATKIGANSFLNISHLWRLIAPYITGNPLLGNRYTGRYNYTETDLYLGIFPLVFVVASLFSTKKKLAWGFSGLGLVTLLAVYGISPFKQIITVLYPVFINTFPGRIFFITTFLWSLAAGLGADWLASRRPIKLTGALGAITLVFSAIILITIGLNEYYAQAGKGSIIFLTGLAKKLIKIDTANPFLPMIILTITTILLWSWKQGWFNRTVFQGLVLALVIFDLFIIGINHNPAFNAKIAFPDTPSLDFIHELRAKSDGPFRLVNINSDSILPGMVPELYDLQTVSGYSSWVLRRYSDYADLTTEREPSSINNVYFDDCCHPLMDALNIAYVYSSSGIPPADMGTLSLISALPDAQIDTRNASNVHTTEWTINGVTRLVLYTHPPTQISYSLDINQPVVLKTAIANDPSTWNKYGDGVLFEVLALEKETNTEKVLFSRYLNPKAHSADRDWVPVEVDLSQFSGKQINLILKTTAGPKSNASFDWAGWAFPQIENYYPHTLKLIYDGPNKVYKNLESLPRAWVVHKVAEVALNDNDAVKKALSAADFDPRTEAVIEGRLNTELGTAHEGDQVKVTSYSDERVELEVNNKEPGLLVLSDVMYPGWRVYVDDIEQPIFTANLIMRSVYLPGGNHRVVFSYKPVLLFIGLIISGIALLVILIAMLWPVRRSTTKTKHAPTDTSSVNP